MLEELLTLPEIISFMKDMDRKVSDLMVEEFRKQNFSPIDEIAIRNEVLKHLFNDSKEALEFMLLNTIK